ncbi:MAG: VanW family protein [Chloroflexi bacterium]|nr:VanW family protein [Chloroflexota bacterium]
MTSTTETLQLTELPRGGRSLLRAAIGAFVVTLLLAAVLAVGFVVGLRTLHQDRIMPGVSVAGVSLAGLERTAAEMALRERLPGLANGSVELTLGEITRTVGYSALGRDYDLTPALDAAFAIGRSGSLADQNLDSLRSLTGGTSLQVGMSFDAEAVATASALAAASAATPAVEATLALAPDAGGWVVTPGANGQAIDEAEIRAALTTAVADPQAGARTIELAPQVVEPDFTTGEAEAVVARAEEIAGRGLVLSMGGERSEVAAATVRRWLTIDRSAAAAGGLGVSLSPEPIGGLVASFAEDVEQEAENASLRFGEENEVVVIPGAEGRTLDAAASAALVEEALLAPATGSDAPAVELAVTTTDPEFSTADAQAMAPRMIKISKWTTYYTVGENNFFGANIEIPTATLDSYFLAPGEVFSFWEAIGEVSRETGYGPGAAILGGRTDTTGALAGGICSCSTTIFNAALRAGLEMGDRRNHYYYISRYPVGLDATVFKGSNTVQDMTFTNDTEYPILIRGINKHGVVKFHLYSVPNGRTVTFSRPQITNRRPATDKVEYVDRVPGGRELAPGERKRVEYPVDGFQVSVTRTVRDESGEIIHQDTFYSNYARITGLTYVGGSDPLLSFPTPGEGTADVGGDEEDEEQPPTDEG